MSADGEDPKRFFTERLPEQFNRALAQQEQAVVAAQKLLDGMQAVEATLQVIVDGECYCLEIDAGRMRVAATPARPPVMTLVLDRAAFVRVAREAGDSAMAFLGGLSGLAREMKLTRSRIENLRGLRGALRFEVVGDDGFVLLTHFGPDLAPSDALRAVRRVAPRRVAAARDGLSLAVERG